MLVQKLTEQSLCYVPLLEWLLSRPPSSDVADSVAQRVKYSASWSVFKVTERKGYGDLVRPEGVQESEEVSVSSEIGDEYDALIPLDVLFDLVDA